MGGPKEKLIGTNGQTLLEFQRERLSPHFPDLLLLGGEHNVEGHRSYPDPSPYEQMGPLAGLLAGLRNCKNPWLALLPIDCPCFPVDSFQDAWSKREPLAEFVGFTEVGAERQQWLPGLFHQSLIPAVECALQQERRALGALVKQSRQQYVTWESSQMSFEEAFTNLNTPEEAARYGYRWESQPH